MLEQVLNKGDVGRDATNTEFAQGTIHAGDGLLGRCGLGGHLGQKAIVIARDDAAGIGGAASRRMPMPVASDRR